MNCCDNQNLIVNQLLEYKCEIIDGGLSIDTDTMKNGDLINLKCANCDKVLDLSNIPYSVPLVME